MTPVFHFSFGSHWQHAPLAHWVHVPDGVGGFAPPAPPAIPHRGYALLHVGFGAHELVFSSPAQLDHCIEVLARKPLPTTRQLSALRGSGAGPNGHWLSRLPATLKAPRQRARLVQELQAVHAAVVVDGRFRIEA